MSGGKKEERHEKDENAGVKEYLKRNVAFVGKIFCLRCYCQEPRVVLLTDMYPNVVI